MDLLELVLGRSTLSISSQQMEVCLVRFIYLLLTVLNSLFKPTLLLRQSKLVQLIRIVF